jgi:hypothetical protein
MCPQCNYNYLKPDLRQKYKKMEKEFFIVAIKVVVLHFKSYALGRFIYTFL